MSLLKVSGTKVVDEEGKEIILRGAGLGGWMNMENFISGYPGCEFQIRHALAFLEYFFMDSDAKFFSSLGLNCIRLPFNYRHFEDDMNPRVLKESGFKHLDRVIELFPGPYDMAWEKLAEHYKSNKWIAGYNPLNEPTDPTHTRVVEFYSRVHSAIRAIDPTHIIFFDGNTFASDFSHFGDAHKNWDNTAYSIHDYSVFGFPASPEPYDGNEQQLRRLRRSYEKKREWMDERGLCVWNGEWGPVYARKQYEGEATEKINEARYQVLKDQLDIYNKDRLSWSIWLYKDIGFQGMVYLDLETPYMTLFQSFLAKKHRLAVDAWGADDTAVKTVYQPLLDHVVEEIPPSFRDLYPAPVWRLSDRVTRLARNILISEFLVKEWAEHFVGKSTEELDAIAASFKFEACQKREGLNKILTDSAKAVV
ncbi:glycoside hydrolase [Mycena leptocephala]|nr:glycoside hydrolase [Mycena leptocephala]